MTAQRDQLESVLAEIDAILGETGPRLPWVMSNDVQQQRQMLAKARQLLTEFKQAQDSSPQQPQPSGQDLTAPAPSPAGLDPTAVASSQVLKALLQEMQYLRGQTMQILDPLRDEVATLKQQRELLLQEVKQLQQQRVQLEPGVAPAPSAGQWEAMLQQVTSHLEAHLAQQLQESVQRLETTAANTYLLTQSEAGEADDETSLTPTQRLEYLKQIQTQSDQLVMSLDRVLRTVFDSLQQSIYSYQDSLGHGLNKMHTLGQQGEMMFNALISHLAQQMNQDALAYLESSQGRTSQSRQLPNSTAATGARAAQPEVEGTPPAPRPQRGEMAELDDLDLDAALNDDEVTLLQLDDEISQLQMDVDQLAVDYDPTREPQPPANLPQSPQPTPASEGEATAAMFDPLEVLDQLDEAVPGPSPSVSLPNDPPANTLEANVEANAQQENSAEEALDDLYQSIFGDVLKAESLTPPAPADVGLEPESGADQTEPPAATPPAALPLDSDEVPPTEEVPAANRDVSEDDLTSLLGVTDTDAEEPGDEGAPIDEQASLDELFGDGTAEQLTEAAADDLEDDAADTVTSLDELLPESQPLSGEVATDFVQGFENNALDDSEVNPWTGETDLFAAGQDENLLTTSDLPQMDNYYLDVDQDLVDQLNEDLSELEAGEESAPSELTDAGADFDRATPDPATAPSAAAEPAPAPQALELTDSEETLEASFANFGDDASPDAPSPAAPEAIDSSFGGDEPEQSAEPPADTIAASFASFGADAPPIPEATPESLTQDGADSSSSDEPSDLFGVDLDSPEEPSTAAAQSSDAAETVEEVFASFGAEPTSPPAADETVEAAFGAFGDDLDDRPAAARSDSAPAESSTPPASPPSDDLWPEAPATVEDNPMPIGDLPSQETIDALLSDLNLDQGDDEPAVGESGFTLDALESLASPPAEPQSRQTAEASPATPEPPPATERQQIRPEPEATPPPSQGAADPYESSLTLENLVGELKLDPLFPDEAQGESLPPVTADNLFSQDSAAPADTAPPQAPEGVDLFGDSPSPEPYPTDSTDQGIDLFGETPSAEPPAAEETSGEPADGGIDLFGDDTSPPIDLDDLDLSLGDDLSDRATAPSQPSGFDGGETPEDQGVDLFGETSFEAPTASEPAGEGIGLFEDSSPAEPDALEGIDLFSEEASAQAPESFVDQGLDLFGETDIEEPGPEEPAVEGLDLFGETGLESPPAAEEAPEEPEIGGFDLYADTPPVEPAASEGLDGIDIFGEESASPAPESSADQGLDLFGEAPLEEPAPEEPAPEEPATEGLDLFGDSSSEAATAESINISDVATSSPNLESPTDQDIDLFGEVDVDPTPAEPAEGIDSLADSFSTEPTVEEPEDQGIDLFSETAPAESSAFTEATPEPPPQPEGDLFTEESPSDDASDDAGVKYTEWLSDISLENILGTSDVAEDVADEPSGDAAASQTEATPETTPEVTASALGSDLFPADQGDIPSAPEADLSADPDAITLPEEDLEPDQAPPVEAFTLEDLASDTPAPETPAETPDFDLADQVPFDASDAEPMGQVPERDFVNLDALLDRSLQEDATEPEEADSEDLDAVNNLTQEFESEIEFIDLDSLLGDSLVDADQASVEDAEVDTEPAPAPPPPESSTPESSTPESPPEPPTSPSADTTGLDELTTLSDLPEATASDLPPGMHLEIDDDLPQPEEGNSLEPMPPETASVEDESLDQLAAELPSAGANDDAPELLLDLDQPPEQRLPDPEPPIQLQEAATFPSTADLPAQGDELFAAEGFDAEVPASETVEPPTDSGVPQEDSGMWFLGLDIGAQGISAVLLQRRTGQVFPLYWVDTTISGATADKFFRLPIIAAVDPSQAETAETGYGVQSVGSSALMVNWDEGDAADLEDETILVKSLKPLLKMGLPLHTPEAGEPQPMMQWSDPVQLPLQTFGTALQELLTTLLPSEASKSTLAVGAVGLQAEDITMALQQLRGVVVSYPANWPDTYPFNVREAVIRAGLVDRPDDIYFLEDAIAAVLSGLPDPTEPSPSPNGQPVQQQTLYACHWSGGTVVISAGAIVTEMGLANLPQDLSRLTYDDFALHSMGYAGDAIDLDIICHLLHPAERRQTRNPDRYRSPSDDGWSWQAAVPELDEVHWDDLDLDSLDFPRIAEPDLSRRYRLQQRLESSLLGQSLLEAVRHLKIILQHQPQFELELADQRWIVRSKDLDDRIILPYIQRINGHLNRLLSEVGLTTQGINQVICTGGSASLPKISRWLRQKFPNATIIQDTYHSDRPPSCSRVAYGLVNLLRYPQVLDLTRHQYSDMFLLMELLRTFPDQPMPLSGILHLLKERGINTEACELHLIALLEGRLPPGLLPATNNPFVQVADGDSPDLQALLTTPLFSRPNNQVYVPNPEQCQRLKAYMTALLADKRQTLMDPLLADLMSMPV